MKKMLSDGIAHKMPQDLEQAILAKPKATEAWEDITEKARNEWICWTVSVKQEKTRLEHVKRAAKELAEGKRRPCCWSGCIHRADKPLNPTQKFLLRRSQKATR